jgi:hypothetical protein
MPADAHDGPRRLEASAHDLEGNVMFKGLLLRESLADTGVLEKVNVTKVETWEPGELRLPAGPIWTATYFEGDDFEADAAADLISHAMHESFWYANIHLPVAEIVIFSGRVFRYVRGDAEARKAPEDYARSLGVPEHQIDWERDG